MTIIYTGDMVGFLNKYISDSPDLPGETTTKIQLSPNQLRSQALLNSLDEAIILSGQNHEIIFVNRRAKVLFELQNWPYFGRPVAEFLTKLEEQIEQSEKLIQVVAQTTKSQSLIADNFVIKLKTATPIYLRCYTGPMHDDSTGYLGRIWKFMDQTSVVTLDRAKSDFIAIASHQLRTPMTSICGYLDMIQSGDYGAIPDNLHEPVSALVTAAERMRELVTELLNSSRLENGKTTVDLTTFDLVELLKHEMDTQALSARERQMLVELFVAASNTTITADRSHVQEAFKNYLSNAIKYGKAGTAVTVKVVALDQKLRISVSDQGVGIPSEAQPHIFSRLYRAQNVATMQGTGLGLYYVKEVIEMMGGQVGFESQENHGSSFWFEVPRIVDRIMQS